MIRLSGGKELGGGSGILEGRRVGVVVCVRVEGRRRVGFFCFRVFLGINESCVRDFGDVVLDYECV